MTFITNCTIYYLSITITLFVWSLQSTTIRIQLWKQFREFFTLLRRKIHSTYSLAFANLLNTLLNLRNQKYKKKYFFVSADTEFDTLTFAPLIRVNRSGIITLSLLRLETT
jgi:hypothetical protein